MHAISDQAGVADSKENGGSKPNDGDAPPGHGDMLPDLTALTRDPEVTLQHSSAPATSSPATHSGNSHHLRATKRSSMAPAGSAALRALHTERFEAPKVSPLQVLLAICAYVLFVTDVPRAGSSLDELPYTEIEPNVFASDGPTVLPELALTPTSAALDGVAITDVPAALFKYNSSSYGMRSILAERGHDGSAMEAVWPACMASTHYNADCGSHVSLATAFAMLDSVATVVRANSVNTTCYKTVGNATAIARSASAQVNNAGDETRDYLSTLPQRVRFAVRTKARWVDGASNFLLHNLLDQKYWISTWATYFGGLEGSVSASERGVDLCVDDLDRPLFCEKTWADFARLAPAGTRSNEVGRLWDDLSDRVAQLQRDFPSRTIDLTLVEAETDPLTFLGGAVLLAHKVYNVVAIFRVRDCTSGVSTTLSAEYDDACSTLELHDVTYEGRVLYTDALEWRVITKAMRYVAQIYNIVRLAALMLGCFLAANATVASTASTTASNDTNGLAKMPFKTRLARATRLFFAIPSQVVVYGSLLPVFLYSSAHVIDGVILYEANDARMHSVDRFLDNRFVDMVQLLSVRMRNVWLLAVLVRAFVFIQTSGGWTPARGISSLRGYLLPLVSLFAVAFVLRNSSLQDARVLETNEVEPAATFMFIRAETLDAWKMNLFGVYNDCLSLFLTCVAYVVARIAVQLVLTRLSRAKTSGGSSSIITGGARSSLFFTSSRVSYAAGFLWEPSCLVVCWDNDLLEPLRRFLPASLVGSATGSALAINNAGASSNSNASVGSTGGRSEAEANGLDARFSSRPSLAPAKDEQLKTVLMNLAFLTDPWNFLAMKFSRTRVYLYALKPGAQAAATSRQRRLLHPYSRSRFVREYELHADEVELQGTFTAAELAWDQVITFK